MPPMTAAPAIASSSSCCARGATHPDAANDLAIDDDGDAALEWGEVIECHHRGAAVLDNVLEDLRGLLEQDGGACLADGDVGAGGERSIEALEGHEVAAFIHDGDHAACCVDLLRFGLRAGDHSPCAVECERFLRCDRCHLCDGRLGGDRE